MMEEPFHDSSDYGAPVSAFVIPWSAEQIEMDLRARSAALLSGSHLSHSELVELSGELAHLAEHLAQFHRQRSQFLDSIIHEIVTPLTVAAGNLEILLSTELTEDQHTRVQRVIAQVDVLKRLSSDLGSSVWKLDVEVTDLVELVHSVVQYQQIVIEEESHQTQLKVRAQIAQGYALIDPVRIAQVLHNLTDNARRYVPSDASGAIEFVVAANDTYVRVSVCDNGVGIAPEHLPHLFEPAYQIKGYPRGRSGLGLAISREIVNAHKGVLWVTSQFGKGARFHIQLPRVNLSPRNAEPSMEAGRE